MKTFTLLLACAACTLSSAPAFAGKGRTPLTVTGTKPEDHATIRVAYVEPSLANATEAAVLRFPRN